MKQTVWFRNHDNLTLFTLNSKRECTTVPSVGDICTMFKEDFTRATYKMKPFDSIVIDFVVVSRKYTPYSDSWSLELEPTTSALLVLLKYVKHPK